MKDLMMNFVAFKGFALQIYHLMKDSRHAWRLLVYYLSEGFKACLEAAGLLP